MGNSFKTGLENSPKQERAAVASQHFSDKPDKVDFNVVANTECLEVGLILQSKALPHSVGRNFDTSLSAEAQRAYSKELLETMNVGVTRTDGLPNLNAQPCYDSGFISQNSKVLYSVALPNVSTNSKVLQLFPEGSTCPSIGTSNSGAALAVTSNDSSAITAQPDSSTGPQEFIQSKIFEPSSFQKRPKLLLDGIQSFRRPQMVDTEAFCHSFPAFANYWSEEELDNLWVGVRRHGKDNWSLMLRDPKQLFSPWRTERDLAETWIMEQTKLLGNSPSHTKPVDIPMPPRPGSMTRFLTDPTQVSLSNPNMNNQGIMLPPMLPVPVKNAPGNGTRLLNQRVGANKRSLRSANSWERFKTRNDDTSRPQFPSPHTSTSRNDLLLPYISATFDHHRPRQHPGNSGQFRDSGNNNAVDISTRNGTHLSSLAIHSSQPCQVKQRILNRSELLINLDSDASSEKTISDDDK